MACFVPHGVRLALVAALLLAGRASAATRYVWTNSPSPTPGFTAWTTAARNIQTALDVSGPNDVIIVTNGDYTVGGKSLNGGITNRVAITNAVVVRSGMARPIR